MIVDWSDDQINDWFDKSEWNMLTRVPDNTINKRLFVEQNLSNPDSWNAALQFIKEADINSMEPGKYVLLNNITASLSEYTTKDVSPFEAHRKYVDIQFLSKGEENIQISPFEPDNQKQVQPYDSIDDFELFEKNDFTVNLLTVDNYFVFFPSDGHKPGMKVNQNSLVRKVVIKIPFVE